jgi:signal transduction histidine kinase
LLAWVALFTAINLFPVPGRYSTSLAPDLPVAVAAAILLSPPEVAWVAFVGAFDPREIRKEISFTKAVFNRSQVSLADLAASLVAHLFIRGHVSSTALVPLSFVALATILLVNFALVAPVLMREHGRKLGEVAIRLHPGTPGDQAVTFLSWGILAIFLVALFDQVRLWALPAFIAPSLLGRQVLSRSQMLTDAVRAYRDAEEALIHVSKQIQEERYDERRLIAADLHDEVLQPLFNVSLMAQVVKGDLATGRLLEADEDLPQLVSAAERASSTLRGLISDLRKSPLGRRGIDSALKSMSQTLEVHTRARIHVTIQEVELPSHHQLVLYQIAREAVLNSVTHSRARNIWLDLSADKAGVHLAIRDDGVGFDPEMTPEGHFGLQIMRERAASVGLAFDLWSQPGKGTRVRLHMKAPAVD